LCSYLAEESPVPEQESASSFENLYATIQFGITGYLLYNNAVKCMKLSKT